MGAAGFVRAGFTYVGVNWALIRVVYRLPQHPTKGITASDAFEPQGEQEEKKKASA